MTYDYLICGSGIAGASLAYELSPYGKVLVVEAEEQHGYHTTGRSAAMYIESYGAAPLRRLTAASRAFFDAPPQGFSDYPLLTPRGCMNIATAEQLEALASFARDIAATGVEYQQIDGAAARARVPILHQDAVVAALFEPHSCDIDANGLHAGYLKLAQARGVEFRLSARLQLLQVVSEGWRATLADGHVVAARVVINAAGAWADAVARLAGAAPMNLAPKRRTAIILDAPPGVDIANWPAVMDVDEQFYFKPEAGRILASPADETPSEALDAAPEELDIAICVDRIQTAADLPVRRVVRAWAGLRTFAPDRVPVFGYDPKVANFFWYAGQGGYGMQIAPAAARLGAALVRGQEVPTDIADHGLVDDVVSPSRIMLAIPGHSG